jgi:arylsulfatase A-like enzyme
LANAYITEKVVGKTSLEDCRHISGQCFRLDNSINEQIRHKSTTWFSHNSGLGASFGFTSWSLTDKGKWHLSDNPLQYGFEVNIGGGHSGHPQSYYPPYGNVKIKGGDDDYLTDLIMEKTIEFVDSVSSPFFLCYAPYAVHTPIHPVESLVEKYNQKPGSNGQNNAKYATMVENLDRNIGLLITKLKDKGIFNNTLIVFTSDNGGLYGITKQYPLRAGKGSFYEGSIRVPFFFVFKDRISANSKSNIPITNLDIFPTILHYTGINNTRLKLDGNNLSSILEGKTDKLDRPLYWHFPIYLQANNEYDNESRDPLFRKRPGSVIRYGDWKLHYYFENDEVELYNLAQDIGERNNLAIEEPEKKDELLNYLKNWWNETKASIPTRLNPEYKLTFRI